MREFVLDGPPLRRAEGAPRAPDAERLAPPVEDDRSLLGLRRTTWRTIGVLLLLEPLVLVAFYWALGEPSLPHTEERATAPRAVMSHEMAWTRPAAATPAPIAAAAAVPPRARIVAERGRIVVDLSSASAADAIAQLAAVTGTDVSGAQIFAGDVRRLSRSVVVASPHEAWQAVFGPIANFAIACANDGCRVRFISLIEDATGRSAPVVAPAAAQTPVGTTPSVPVAAVPAILLPASTPGAFTEPFPPAWAPGTARPSTTTPAARDTDASED